MEGKNIEERLDEGFSKLPESEQEAIKLGAEILSRLSEDEQRILLKHIGLRNGEEVRINNKARTRKFKAAIESYKQDKSKVPEEIWELLYPK